MLFYQQKDIWQGSINYVFQHECNHATREQATAIKDHSQTFTSRIFDGLEKDLRDRGYLLQKSNVHEKENARHEKENARPRSAKKERDAKNKDRDAKKKDDGQEDSQRLQMLRERCASLRSEVQEKEAERTCLKERVSKKFKEDPSFTDVSELEKAILDLRSQVTGNSEETMVPERLLPAERLSRLLSRVDEIKTIMSSLEGNEAPRSSLGQYQQIVPVPVADQSSSEKQHWHLLRHVDRLQGFN